MTDPGPPDPATSPPAAPYGAGRLAALVAAIDDLGSVVAPTDARRELADLCRTVRLALGAAACSVARVAGETLVYEAADGAGADTIVGTTLPAGRGLAGYVARSAQALSVDRVSADPRFAADIAEETGFVPTSLLAVPIVGVHGDVLGVLSVLDRDAGGTIDGLGVASAAADQAAHVLARVDLVVRLGPAFVHALADTMATGDADLAQALRLAADSATAEEDTELLELTAVLSELRALPPVARASAERIVREVVALATTSRGPSRRPR